jgi:hypothetical protein
MPQIPDKYKPTQGFSHAFHLALNALLPILAYILVRIDFAGLAILLVIVSKWRIFAVKPRYWLANIISSGVDILVGVSLVIFMANTTVAWWQIFWALAYAGWLIVLKPRSDVLSVSAQAMIGQLLGLTVLYLKFGDSALAWLVLGTWGITYLAARHFFTSFDEPQFALLSHLWAWFAASLAFILGHWLLFYGTIAQIIVLLTTIGYGLAAFYYLDATDKLTILMQRQLLAIMLAILLIVLILSDWTGATV